MCQHSSDHSSNLGTTRSKFLQQRHLDDNLTNGELRKSHSQESDMLGMCQSSTITDNLQLHNFDKIFRF